MYRLITFLILLTLSSVSSGGIITKLQGTYSNGQVFLTWKNIPGEAYYKVYRSKVSITGSTQLAGCEYLGWTDKNSAQDNNLSAHNGIVSYYHLDSNDIPLKPGVGLFVATTLEDGNYFYAVTSILNGVENLSVVAGSNSITQAIAETVAITLPVFQIHDQAGNESIDIYTIFYSTKKAIGEPLQNRAGFIAMDFALNPHFSGEGVPGLKVLFHGGGDDFFWGMQKPPGNMIVLGMEELLPNDASDLGYGSNENYDFYKDNTDNEVPTSGINYDFQQAIIFQAIDWVINHLPVDSNRVYLKGTSMGAGSAFMYAIAHPERIAALLLTVPCFNYSFQNDYNPICALNTGNQARMDGDIKFGKVSTNLFSNAGIRFYDAVNGGWMIHTYQQKNFPMIFALNGKHDEMVGWTEKPVFYDSVKANHTGGYFFWDGRNHGGNNSTWNDESYDLFRYASNRSFPAFANCSNDEDYGIGNDVTGADYGTVNGSLNWDESSIVDSLYLWQVKIFVRDLLTNTGLPVKYPDSCTVDIAPRRLQQFEIAPGSTFNWTVTHKNTVIQSGSQVYDGGLIVIPGIKIFKDSSIITLVWSNAAQLFFRDIDNDGYGNALEFIAATIPPPGYVVDSTDCNDNNNLIHPGATDFCNGIDDNCNGAADENSIVANVNPSGNIELCEGSSVILSASIFEGITFQWFKNGISISGATNATYTVTKKGNYYVSETNSYSCSSSSAKVKVSIIAAPTASITPLGNLDICFAGYVDLQANAGIAFTYQWQKGNAVLTGATDQNYTATTKGNYKVMVTNSAECSKTSLAVKVVKSCKESGVHANAGIASIVCFPNPSNGRFTISLDLIDIQAATATVEIINVFNQIVYVAEVVHSGEKLNTVMGEHESFSAGIYTVRVITGDHVFSERVVVQR
ncbi:MAG: MopE-related protein [Chitinophagales bacterium]